MTMILDPENVLKLKRCRRELLSTLDYDLMAPALIQENIISTGEYQTLKTNPGGNIEKVRMIFNLENRLILLLCQTLIVTSKEY